MVTDNYNSSTEVAVKAQPSQAFSEVLSDWHSQSPKSDKGSTVPLIESQTGFDTATPAGSQLDMPNIFAQTATDKHTGCTNSEVSTEKSKTDPNWHASSEISTPQEQKWFNQSEQQREKSLQTDSEGYYTTKDGDSLWTVAQRAVRDQDKTAGKSENEPTAQEVKQKMEEINRANPELAKQPDLLHSGQKILIPCAQEQTGIGNTNEFQPPHQSTVLGGSDAQAPEVITNIGTEGPPQSILQSERSAQAPEAVSNVGTEALPQSILQSESSAQAPEAVTNVGTEAPPQSILQSESSAQAPEAINNAAAGSPRQDSAAEPVVAPSAMAAGGLESVLAQSDDKSNRGNFAPSLMETAGPANNMAEAMAESRTPDDQSPEPESILQRIGQFMSEAFQPFSFDQSGDPTNFNFDSIGGDAPRANDSDDSASASNYDPSLVDSV